jgi:hypothetical protein
MIPAAPEVAVIFPEVAVIFPAAVIEPPEFVDIDPP